MRTGEIPHAETIGSKRHGAIAFGARAKTIVAVLFLIAVSSLQLIGQTFALTGSVLAGGGGMSATGQFSVSGTVGQVAPGASAGGQFALQSGIWPVVVALQMDGGPFLQLGRSGGTLTFSWAATTPGLVLEVLSSFGGVPNWQPVVATPVLNNGVQSVTLTIEPGPGARFYRLRKP